MRVGTRTVVTLQPHYRGPADAFALVIPVPGELTLDAVRVLPPDLLDRLELLGAPRLEEYWERDPCAVPEAPVQAAGDSGDTESSSEGEGEEPTEAAPTPPEPPPNAPAPTPADSVEAERALGEYRVIILGAHDSRHLGDWLRERGYRFPEGAEALLAPYVEAGMRFVVAKVDPRHLDLEEGRTRLSPLRFHYDSRTLTLPVRPGALNAEGTQDLLIHVLASRRYVVSDYSNTTIPTNLTLEHTHGARFAETYVALFDQVVGRHGVGVVTEYAWAADRCDPCPTEGLTERERLALGADVLPRMDTLRTDPGSNPARRARETLDELVLTRLHARYDPDRLSADFVFRPAAPIVGGREQPGDDEPVERGARRGERNAFQARYAIRHHWGGPIDCDDPIQDRWGGPPMGFTAAPLRTATDLAFTPRGEIPLGQAFHSAIPELGVAADPPPRARRAAPRPSGRRLGCGACSLASGEAGSSPPPLGFLLLFGAALARRRVDRRVRSRR